MKSSQMNSVHARQFLKSIFLLCVFQVLQTMASSAKTPGTNAVVLSKKKIDNDSGFPLSSVTGLGRALPLWELDNPVEVSRNTLSFSMENMDEEISEKGYELYYRVFIDSTLANTIMGVRYTPSPYTRIWWDNNLIVKEGGYDSLSGKFRHERWSCENAPFYSGKSGWHSFVIRQAGSYENNNLSFSHSATIDASFRQRIVNQEVNRESLTYIFISEGFRFYLLGIFIVSLLFYLLVQRSRSFLWFGLFSFSLLLLTFSDSVFMRLPINPVGFIFPVKALVLVFSAFALICFFHTHYTGKIPKSIYFFFGIPMLMVLFRGFTLSVADSIGLSLSYSAVIFFLGLIVMTVTMVVILFVKGLIKKYQGVNIIGTGILQFAIVLPLGSISVNGETLLHGDLRYFLTIASIYYLPTSFLISLILVVKKNFEENLSRQQKVIDLTRAQEKILAEQNLLLEQQVELRTTELREEKQKVEEKNTEILDSINYAHRIQTTILPSDAGLKKHFSDMFLLYMPKAIVAGDFYWMHEGGEKHPGWVFFAVCDCTGHGVPGALLSVVCSKALHRAVELCKEADPGKILDIVTRLVSHDFSENKKDNDEIYDGMDVSICAYHPGQRKLKWAGANNPLWLVSRQGEIISLQEIKPDKQSVGINDNIQPFMSHILDVNPGDCLYIFSDGYADQFGGERQKKFSTSAFRQLLLRHSADATQEQHKALLQTHVEWKGALEQVDDICVWGIRL